LWKSFQLGFQKPRLAGAAANRGAAEAHVAAAAVFAALGAAIAAGLQASAALLVAAGAMNAAAVGGVLALAVAIGKRAIAALNAILRAAAAAAAVAQHAAKILQCGARQFVFTTTVNFETAGALFEFYLATRHYAPIALRSCGRKARRLPRLRRSGLRRGTDRESFHHYGTGHEKLLFFWPSSRSGNVPKAHGPNSPLSLRLAKTCGAASGQSSERRTAVQVNPPVIKRVSHDAVKIRRLKRQGQYEVSA
jgi:hypothetical protein